MSAESKGPAVKRKNVAPVRIEHPASAEALRMIQEWCAEMDRRHAAMGDSRGGVNMLETIRQLHLAESSSAKSRGRGDVPLHQYIGVGSPDTADGVATRNKGPRFATIEEWPDLHPHPEEGGSVMETDRFLSHLRSLDPPSYFVLVSWGQRRAVVEIARAIPCSVNTVYANLKSAVLTMTSHILLRTFA